MWFDLKGVFGRSFLIGALIVAGLCWVGYEIVTFVTVVVAR